MGVSKRKVGIIVGSAVLVVLCAVISRNFYLTIEPPPPPPIPAFNVPPQPEVVEDTIQRNTTLVATLIDYDIPVTIAHDVADLIKPVFDVRRIRFGNPFRLEKELDGSLRKFEYKIDDERILKVEKSKD